MDTESFDRFQKRQAKQWRRVADYASTPAYNHRVIALLFLAEMIQDEPTEL